MEIDEDGGRDCLYVFTRGKAQVLKQRVVGMDFVFHCFALLVNTFLLSIPGAMVESVARFQVLYVHWEDLHILV